MISKISNITFGSTYTVTSLDNRMNSYHEFMDFCRAIKNTETNVQTKQDFFSSNKGTYGSYEITVPDKEDFAIEAYCRQNNIRFRTLSMPSIESNPSLYLENLVKPQSKKLKKAYIKAEKLEDLILSQDSNFKSCKKIYNESNKEEIENILDEGFKIPMSRLKISSNGGIFKRLKEKDLKNLSPWNLSINFVYNEKQFDTGTYFFLRESGMDLIPVCMDSKTYKAANALGLIENREI